jgi:hypothetical protein
MATNSTDLEELKKNVNHVFLMTNAIIVCCKFAAFIPVCARLYVQLQFPAVSGFAPLFIYRVRINYRRILQNRIFTNTEQKHMILLPYERGIFTVSC